MTPSSVFATTLAKYIIAGTFSLILHLLTAQFLSLFQLSTLHPSFGAKHQSVVEMEKKLSDRPKAQLQANYAPLGILELPHQFLSDPSTRPENEQVPSTYLQVLCKTKPPLCTLDGSKILAMRQTNDSRTPHFKPYTKLHGSTLKLGATAAVTSMEMGPSYDDLPAGVHALRVLV